MEKEISRLIARSLIEVVNDVPFERLELDAKKIETILKSIILPQESSRMQFPISITFYIPGSSVNLNTQFSSKLNMDFVLHRVLTNYKTGYSPLMVIRNKRLSDETQFFKNYCDYQRENAEVICRIARNDSKIWPLMNECYKEYGLKNSAMGFLEILYTSKKRDHQKWGGIPILGIPLKELTSEEKLERKNEILKTIVDFGLKHQRPTADFLIEEGYTTNY